MRILVICGAGASSTFVAQRLRHAAHAAGVECTAFAGTEASLPIDLDSADMVLVGPHLHPTLAQIESAAEARGTTVVLLPDDIFNDFDGSRTLALVREKLPLSGTPRPAGASAQPTPTTHSNAPAVTSEMESS